MNVNKGAKPNTLVAGPTKNIAHDWVSSSQHVPTMEKYDWSFLTIPKIRVISMNHPKYD
jgi:hypothetical protein